MQDCISNIEKYRLASFTFIYFYLKHELWISNILGAAGKVTCADLFGLIFKYYCVIYKKLTGTLKNHAIQIHAPALT